MSKEFIPISAEEAVQRMRDIADEYSVKDMTNVLYKNDDELIEDIKQRGLGGIGVQTALILNGGYNYCYKGDLTKDIHNAKVNAHSMAVNKAIGEYFDSADGKELGYMNISDILLSSRAIERSMPTKRVVVNNLAEIVHNTEVTIKTDWNTVVALSDLYKDVVIEDGLREVAVGRYKLDIEGVEVYVAYIGDIGMVVYEDEIGVGYSHKGHSIVAGSTEYGCSVVDMAYLRKYVNVALIINEYLKEDAHTREVVASKRARLGTSNNRNDTNEGSKDTTGKIYRDITKERVVYITSDEVTGHIKRVGEIKRKSCEYQFSRRGHWARSKKTGKRWWVRETTVNAAKPTKEIVYKIHTEE